MSADVPGHSDGRRQEKTFRAGITRDFLILAAVLIVFGLGTLEVGFIIEREFVGKGSAFFAIGGLFIATVFIILYNVTGCRLIVTPDEITYRDRWSQVTIPWSEAADFHDVQPDQKYFRSAYLLNDRLRIKISSMSFVKFDTILSVVRVARRSKYYHEDLYQV